MPPLRVLVIARWYPAVDDPVRGSFVADQVAALAATGAVDLVVASFEFVRLNRVRERQEPEREAVQCRYGVALEREDALVPGGWPAITGTWPGISGVPVARLPVASGPDDPPAREAADHLAAFRPFLDSLVSTEIRRASADPNLRPAFDLVHAHTGFPDGVVAAEAARRLGVPYVITEHSSRTAEILADPEIRREYIAALSGAARIIVVSAALGRELRDALPEVAATLDERLGVVPNAVPVDLFRPPPIARRARGTLLYVGSRKADKGMSTLLEAFALAHAERRRGGGAALSLRLIGRSPTEEDEARWRSRADELGVADAVSFEPATDRAGVAEAMTRADVFVHPSRRETFGVVAAEALAAGLPVVATASGGVEETLGADPAAVGAVVPVDDAAAMARAILDVVDRRETFDPERLRALAVERFAAAGVAERLLETYRVALGSGPSGKVEGDAGRSMPQAAEAASAPGSRALPDSTPAPLAVPRVVGFNRVRATRLLAPLPPDLRSRLILVTADAPAEQSLPDGLRSIVEVDLDAGYRAALEAARPPDLPKGMLGRALRFARDPGASDRIAGIHARRTELRLETAQAAVRAAAVHAAAERAAAERAASAAPGDVVCLDGYDVRACEPAIEAGVARLAPGGVRWLADGWAAGRYGDVDRANEGIRKG